MIKILEHPLVAKDVTIIRNSKTDSDSFRNALKRIGYHLAINCYDELPLKETEVQTPLETTTGHQINENVVLIPILRAGLALLPSFLEIYPDAKVGYAALKRNEVTFESEEYYYSLPKFDGNTTIVILEIMLATGGSIISVLSKLQLEGAQKFKIISVVSAPEGIEKIASNFPEADIITAVMDRELNEKKYILPGLGDAGDRVNNTVD